jgi:uncharacterized protein
MTQTMNQAMRSPTSTTTTTSAVGSAQVPMRQMDFRRQLDDLPKYFTAEGDIVSSHVIAVLSSVFPDGEDYFVRSVKAARADITDPGLAADVDGFVGQESMHGREHRLLNERLAELGYPTAAIGKYVRVLTAIRERVQGKKANLGFTAALEHYTATLAETVLTDPEARAQIAHRGVRDLLIWHSLEEAEHKAVAFDVFKSVGGSERMRVTTMWLTHLTFVLETGIWTLISVARDRDARRQPRQLVRSLWHLRKSPFGSPRAVRQLFEYNRRCFHPNDRGTAGLVTDWRERLFGDEGELRPALAS